MRSFPGYDEFYWDATGFEWDATLKQVDISAQVPGGARELTCYVGAVGSKQTCSNRIKPDKTAQFSASNVPPGEGVTIGVKIASGLVTNNQPILEPDGSQLTAAERTGLIVLGVGAAVLTIGSPLVGFLWWRKNGRDQRYAGLAPGTTPLAGQPAHVVTNDPGHRHPGGLLAAAHPGGGGRPAGRRPGRHPGDRGHHHRSRRARGLDRTEHR